MLGPFRRACIHGDCLTVLQFGRQAVLTREFAKQGHRQKA